MSKYLFNTTEEAIIIKGKTIPANDYYLIQSILESAFSADSELLIHIANATIIISKTDDSSGHISDVNSAIDYLKNKLPSKVEAINQPFGSKILTDGSKLFRRVRGISASVQGSPDNIDFVVPFTKCKITGLQILNAKLGDKVTFQILDTETGTLSGIPYYVLNTFGQDVFVKPDVADYPSKYDADLIAGLTLRIIYDAVDELLPRTIYVNYDLHEVIVS